MTGAVTVVQGSRTAMEVQQTEMSVEIAIVGGAPGPAGERSSFVATTGESVGGLRVVHIDSDGLAYLASPSTAVAKRPAGITSGAATSGSEVQILTGDDVEDPSWAWTPGAVYLGAAGVLTQTIPTADAVYLVGIAAGPTRLRITPSLIAQL